MQVSEHIEHLGRKNYAQPWAMVLHAEWSCHIPLMTYANKSANRSSRKSVHASPHAYREGQCLWRAPWIGCTSSWLLTTGWHVFSGVTMLLRIPSIWRWMAEALQMSCLQIFFQFPAQPQHNNCMWLWFEESRTLHGSRNHQYGWSSHLLRWQGMLIMPCSPSFSDHFN